MAFLFADSPPKPKKGGTPVKPLDGQSNGSSSSGQSLSADVGQLVKQIEVGTNAFLHKHNDCVLARIIMIIAPILFVGTHNLQGDVGRNAQELRRCD